ncbi:MAG: DNA-binding response regulator [Hyphomicrobiales bacterium]|nr:MAG: DNA-binding response regulator [Hyphomicrobiales bacterium]
MRILIVEDDETLIEGIAYTLEKEKWFVEKAASGEEAWFQGSTEDFDAIVLDLSLPELDGTEILKRWRRENISTPVLILTSRSGWLDRVNGINLGADDYLTKPFRMEELVARLRAIIRRSKGHSNEQILCGGVAVDLLEMSASVNGDSIELGPLEWRALTHLMMNRGSVIPSHELIDHVYGPNSDRNVNAMEALIKRLRKKLGVPLIHTRRGSGYLVQNDAPGTDDG